MQKSNTEIVYRVAAVKSVDLPTAVNMLTKWVNQVIQDEDYVELSGGVCVLAEQGGYHVFQAMLIHRMTLPEELAERIFQTQEIAK